MESRNNHHLNISSNVNFENEIPVNLTYVS